MGALQEHYNRLRSLIVSLFREASWPNLPKKFEDVGLAWREDLQHLAKDKYLNAVMADIEASTVVKIARKCLDELPLTSITATIQDELWWIEAGGKQEVTELTRRAILDALSRCRVSGRLKLQEFRKFAFPDWEPDLLIDGAEVYAKDGTVIQYAGIFSAIFSPPSRRVFGAQSPQSSDVHRITTAELLQKWGLLAWPDRRLFRFLEATVNPNVRQGDEQRQWVTAINVILKNDGYALQESERISGHPIYATVAINRGVKGRPKNLIFASNGPKPTLGFIDAINNDIAFLDNEDSCLIYEDAIGDDGLTWDTLVRWWAKDQGIEQEAKARKSLGLRLMESLSDSPPERLLFKAYFDTIKEKLGERLPALIPQVYLHYDPKTKKERNGEKKFPIQRMDFLLLLPRRIRVVIEVDGQQHYSKDGKPSPQVYAETVRGDRELRMAGYEVYRFAGVELQGDEGCRIAAEFFETLFRQHGLLT